jgi:hypothetical protein
MKILGRYLFVSILLLSPLFANVKAYLSQSLILEGDEVSLVIEANGDSVKFPKIKKISKYKIISRSTSRSMVLVNGKMEKKLSKKYTFKPRKDLIVPSFDVEVDGEMYKSEPLKLVVKKEIKGKSSPFIFELKVNKNRVYIGEPLITSFIFKQRVDVDLAEANFNAPSFNNFWAKTTQKVPNRVEGDYTVYEINYILYPQKSGTLEIKSGRMDAGILKPKSRDFFSFERVKWKSLYSNSQKIEVKSLPSGVTNFGKFTFKVSVDKKSVDANEPVNLSILIEGEGNVEAIEEFSIDIDNAIVYPDKPKRGEVLDNGKNRVSFKQKFALVSDRNFTIPSLEFKYFDSKSHVVKSLKSEPFLINVKPNINYQKMVPKLEKLDNNTSSLKEVVIYKDSSILNNFLYLFGGFLLGVGSILLVNRLSIFNISKSSEEPLFNQIKSSKSDKELLNILLPYTNRTDQMREIIRKLEDNIYSGGSFKIDKKDLLKNLENFLVVKVDERDILK